MDLRKLMLLLGLGSGVALLSPSWSPAQVWDTYDDEREMYVDGDWEEAEDVEWESGEGYHEEEWYDPSDWFDWDAGVEYEVDDWGWDTGYYGDYYDDDYGVYDGAYDYDADDWDNEWYGDSDAWWE